MQRRQAREFHYTRFELEGKVTAAPASALIYGF
jgi:hypothetical protein